MRLILVALALMLSGCRVSPLAPEAVRSIEKPFAVADTLGNSGSFVGDVEYRVWLTPDALVLTARWKANDSAYRAYVEPGYFDWYMKGTVNQFSIGTVATDDDEIDAPLAFYVVAVDQWGEYYGAQIPCILTSRHFRLEIPLSLLGPGPYYYTLGFVQNRDGRPVDPIDPLKGIATPDTEGSPTIAALDGTEALTLHGRALNRRACSPRSCGR